MRTFLIVFLLVIPVLFSCKQDSKSTTTKHKNTSEFTENIESRKHAESNEKHIDTEYKYSDANGKNLIIQNSLPKGGQKYTDPNGKAFIYAIFFTQIINQTDSTVVLTLDFPNDSFELPSSPHNYFKIVLPSDTMTIDKTTMFNYGLTDLKATLDKKLQKSASSQIITHPNETSVFYVVTLFKNGVKGTVRAGFSLKDNKLHYRVNDKEMNCGHFNIKNLKLQK